MGVRTPKRGSMPSKKAVCRGRDYKSVSIILIAGTTIIEGNQKYQQNKASWNHVGVLKTNRNKSSVERWFQISDVNLPIVGKATSKKAIKSAAIL